MAPAAPDFSLTAMTLRTKLSLNISFLERKNKMALRENERDTDFDTVIKKHVWRLIGIGTVIGAVLTVIFFAGYHYAGISLFCGSCHSMENNYFTWQASKHKQFACIECHLPRGNTACTAVYKAYAGIRDILSETTRMYPYTIKLTGHARSIANENCFRCHFSTVEETQMTKADGNCTKCHKFLVHGRPLEQGGFNIE